MISRHAFGELERILLDKLTLDGQEVATLLGLLGELCPTPTPTPDSVSELSGDPDDDKIIASAVAAGADYLVSGDAKHVLPLGRVDQMQIMRPQDFLAHLSP